MRNGLRFISFDLDGTLVDLEYNDLIWFKEIPELVAQKKQISFNESRQWVKEEYNKLGEHNLDWYDIKYWISYFGLEVSYQTILNKYASEVKIFADVFPTLDELKKDFELIIITAMPREFLTPKIKKLENYFSLTFSALTDFKKLKSSTVYSKISTILKVDPEQILHIGDHWEFDYCSARQAGLQALYLDRSKTRKEKEVIYNLEEIKIKIKDKDLNSFK